MKPVRQLLVAMVGAGAILVVTAASALAQTHIDNSVTPVRNTGGWVYWLSWVLGALALLVVVGFVVAYMRYAPHFAKDEESAKAVHADRVLPGKEPPRRAVDLTQAVPIVVQPPALPAAMAAVAAPTVAAPAATEAPAVPVPAPAAAAPSVETAPAAAEAPAAAAPAPAAAAPAAPEERPEVSVDQDVYDATLEELLAQGTDRRIAEGRAKRAGMLAARKKATGEG
ncbi:MAG TPA: hypothetical protein VLX89_06230 [Actinomycetota bacterium]|nr:hypothetical protein [Actinomycetota bacterium]